MPGPHFIGFTPEQAKRIASAVKKVERLPAAPGASRAPVRAPGSTYLLIGVLTADVSYSSSADQDTYKGTFQPWGAPTPDDDTSVEASLTDYDPIDCWPWCLEDGTKITSGARVLCASIAGRWYVIDSNRCPAPIGG